MQKLRSVLDLWIVFLLAVAALAAYVWLGLRGVPFWKLLPLFAYVAWAQFWLLTPPRRRTPSNTRAQRGDQ